MGQRDAALTTKHAQSRAQQRGIPKFLDELLDRYGQEQYDDRGGVIRYFDSDSIRAMERDMGRAPVSRLFGGEWRNAYKVSDARTNTTITCGHRTQRIWRK